MKGLVFFMDNTDNIKLNWENIKEAVKKEYFITNIAYNTWIQPLSFHSIEENTIIITIPSDQSHSMNYISEKYKKWFQVTISEMFDFDYDIRFVLEKDVDESSISNDYSIKSPVYNSNYENAHLNPKYKFETFVVGSNNKLAHSASLAVAENPGINYNPLYLYGGPGLGKTHLMHSIGHYILENNPEKKVLYVTSEEFTNEVIESIRSGNAASMTNLREKYRTVDVLMVDDVQFIIGKESTQEEFFHTFNALHDASKQIILSSDRPPKEMETLDERFRSRFSWGLTADIQQPDYETKIAILMKNAENADKKVSYDVIQYIANNINSNIRELEGAFNKIIAFSKLNKVEIDLPMAEEALKDMIYPNKPKEITPDLILSVVSEHFGVKKDDITSKKRNSEYVLPRQIIMYLCRELISMPYQEIADLLNKKDHTTIMHGYNNITNDIKTNDDFKNKIDIIIKKINPT